MENVTLIYENTTSGAPDMDIDWILATIISVICIGFLIAAAKICYNYWKHFPGTVKDEEEQIGALNRIAISMKGNRGNRYSVA